ncbi:MAG TPA: glutamine synthetase family protein [Chthonomonadaceae bacterium]|nr:glutamine synthetase family protein [Chthonomonadaceae bacterium]
MTPKPIPGMLTLNALAAAVAHGQIDTVLTTFPDLYGRLLGKRMAARYFLDHVAEGGTHVCDYLLACDMEMDPVPGYRFASWEAGYGDLHAVPDLSTLRQTSWLPGTALVLCNLLTEPGDQPVEVAPRRMLQRQLEHAQSAGFTVMGGTELEMYVFNETYDTARAKGYRGLQTASAYMEDYHIFQGTREEGLLRAIRLGLDGSGVPIESTKGEWGPGQQEINLRYCDALTQADRATLCKHGAREIAHLQERAVTFMAKWDEKTAGSGLHVHVSLWDLEGNQNRFAGDTPLGSVHGSDAFRWFLGGLMTHSYELTALFAPYVASYKRFQAGSFAPTGIAWSADNRTAGFRVVGHGPSLRVECRIPGADANPYLVYAAVLAAGLEGIRAHIEPPPPFTGDVYQAQNLPHIPGSLRDSIAALEGSEMARRAFGTDVVEHYLHFLRTEQRKFDEVVTDWEKSRFFERI